MASAGVLLLLPLLRLTGAEILRAETGEVPAVKTAFTTSLRAFGQSDKEEEEEEELHAERKEEEQLTNEMQDILGRDDALEHEEEHAGNEADPSLARDGPVASLDKLTDLKMDTVHIGFMIVGQRRDLFDQTWQVMDNILEFTTSPVKFYLFVDEQAKRMASLSAVLRNVRLVSVDSADMKEKMKVVQGAAERKSKIPVAKLYACEMLPEVSKLIILDSDIVVVDDIAKLWKEFDKFSPTDIGAMAVSQDGFYILHGHRTRKPTKGMPGSGRGSSDESFKGFDLQHPGFNGGVMLQHLDRMREQKFPQLLEQMVLDGLKTDFMGDHPIPELRLGDQSFMSEWPFVYPEHGIRMLPNAWNFQLCEGLWAAFKDGPQKLEEFTKLYNYPPQMHDKEHMPSLLHGNCGYGKSFVIAVQKKPHQFDALLKAWSKHTKRSKFAQGLTNACAMISGAVQKRFLASHPSLPRHGLPWLKFGLLGRFAGFAGT